MKKLSFIILITFYHLLGFTQVAINSTRAMAASSAILDIRSSSAVILIPRLTTNQKTTINSQANGLLVFDTDTKSLWYYNTVSSILIEVISLSSNTLNNLIDSNTDSKNVFIGTNTGTNNDGTLNQNTGTGTNSLFSNTIGTNNSAYGYSALNLNTILNYNSAFGSKSLEINTVERNTAMGYYSLHSNTTGTFNIGIGYRTGYYNQTGNNNTFIGYNARINNTSAKSNSTAIGNDAVITASNQVRIGNTSVTSIGGYANWTNISDGRFKSEVSENVIGLDFILKLRPVIYKLNINLINNFLSSEKPQTVVGNKSNIKQSGFIAQEVEQVAKDTGYDFSGIDVPDNENDHYGLRYASFVVPLVKAV